MLGEATIAADIVVSGAGAFAAGAVAGASLRFSVEEEEMLIDLKLMATLSHATVGGMVDATFFIDGADIADAADGLVRESAPTIADNPFAFSLERTVRLARGEHRMELRLKTPAGDVTVEGAGWPAKMTARRHSHPASLAHGVDSKVQGIF